VSLSAIHQTENLCIKSRTIPTKMDAFVCCNPIHVDDEQIDIDLEEIWELQRQKSKGGWVSSSQRKGRINFLRGNKNRRGFSLTRKNSKGAVPAPQPKGNFRRSTSRGRNRFDSEDPGRERKSRSPWGRRKDKKVSINKYVEQIETTPKRYSSRARGRSSERANSRSRPASITRGIGRQRTRSWSLGRRNTKSDRQIIRVRSKSRERIESRQEQSPGYAEAFTRGLFGGGERDQYQQERQTDYGDAPKRGLFGGMGRRRREEESWSSSEESYDGGGGFFSSFR